MTLYEKHNPEGWKKLKKLLSKSNDPEVEAIRRRVLEDYEDVIEDEEDAIHEILAFLLSDAGIKRLREEQERVMADEKMPFSTKAKKLGWLRKLGDALRNIWEHISEYFGKRIRSWKDLFKTPEKGYKTVQKAKRDFQRRLIKILEGRASPNDLEDLEREQAPRRGYAERGGRSDDVYSSKIHPLDKEIEEIVARAKADGTFGKAPNGKPSKLDARTWAVVRTGAFKNWFGDWEKAARKSLLDYTHPVSLSNNTSISQKEAEAIFGKLRNGENRYDGRRVKWVKSVVGKLLRHRGFDLSRLIPSIKEVFDDSVPMLSEPNEHRKGHKEHTNINAYHHYVGKVSVDDRIYYVRFTVQETNTHKSDVVASQLHSAYVSDIEIMSAAIRVNTGNTPATANNDTPIDAKLQQILKEARDAENNVSWFVDTNGEPKVFYHNTDADFTVFDASMNGTSTDAGWLGDGFYFYGDKNEGRNYGKNQLEVFLNVREPYFATNEELEHLSTTNSRDESIRFREEVEGEGYDGVYYDGDMRQEAVVFYPNQIKSPRSLGFDSKKDDIHFLMTKSTRSQVEKWIDKYRPDLPAEMKKETLDYIDGLKEDAKGQNLERATGWWFARGTVRLPEDIDKIRQAVKVAQMAKVDPTTFNNPQEIINTYTQFTIKEERINPDTVEELSNKRELPNGVTVYDVRDDAEGQRAMRKIIDTHWGLEANPWCLLQGDGKGNVTEDAKGYWKHYSSVPKRVAFQNGKLIAFYSGEKGTLFGYWWDRLDLSHDGVPIEKEYEIDGQKWIGLFEMREPDNSTSEVPVKAWRGNKRNGLYEEYHDGDAKTGGVLYERSYRVNGKLDGRAEFREDRKYENPHIIAHYKDGVLDGPYWEYDESSAETGRGECGVYQNGKKEGLWVSWMGEGEDGEIGLYVLDTTLYKDDKPVEDILYGLDVADDDIDFPPDDEETHGGLITRNQYDKEGKIIDNKTKTYTAEWEDDGTILSLQDEEGNELDPKEEFPELYKDDGTIRFLKKRGVNAKEDIEQVNSRFNEQLDELTQENADNVILRLGKPSPALLAVGFPNRTIALYGNKLLKKAGLHGYNKSDVRDLPKYIADPITVFKGNYDDAFAVLTEMPINGENTLVTIDIRKGEVQDLNLITSVFGKNNKGIIDWINRGKLLYTNKEKTLRYLSSPAPIAGATNNREFLSATNIVKNFTNPKLPQEDSFEPSTSGSGGKPPKPPKNPTVGFYDNPEPDDLGDNSGAKPPKSPEDSDIRFLKKRKPGEAGKDGGETPDEHKTNQQALQRYRRLKKSEIRSKLKSNSIESGVYYDKSIDREQEKANKKAGILRLLLLVSHSVDPVTVQP